MCLDPSPPLPDSNHILEWGVFFFDPQKVVRCCLANRHPPQEPRLSNHMLLDRIQHLEEQLARHPSDQYHHSPQTSEARHSPEHRDQLVDRISELEAQLARTASGEPHVDHQSRGYEIETLESKVAQMEQRLLLFSSSILASGGWRRRECCSFDRVT